VSKGVYCVQFERAVDKFLAIFVDRSLGSFVSSSEKRGPVMADAFNEFPHSSDATLHQYHEEIRLAVAKARSHAPGGLGSTETCKRGL